MDYATAARIAERLCKSLEPACEQIQIAGGIRRRKAQPHDIELVAVAKVEPIYDLYGHEVGERNLLEEALDGLVDNGALKRGAKQGPRYKQFIVLPEGIMLDLFVVRYPAQWGVIYSIRTGPAHYSHWLVTQQAKGGALPDDAYVQDGAVWYDNQPLPMPTEESFFAFLGIPVPNPAEREPRWRQRKES